jgi:hypothetical protein
MKTLSGWLMIVIAVLAVWLGTVPESAERIITAWMEPSE